MKMMPSLNGLFEFMGAMSLLSGSAAIGMAWWRKGSQEEDELMVEAADVVIDNISNADNITNIELLTGKNMRDQLTVEEVLEMDRDRQLRRFGRRN
jgi:hypothetical protein